MSADLPADVRAVLTQLFAEGRDAVRSGDLDTASATTETARTVVRNKLPEGTLRDRLLHGCARVASLLETERDGDAEVAAEYLTVMARRVEKQG